MRPSTRWTRWSRRPAWRSSPACRLPPGCCRVGTTPRRRSRRTTIAPTTVTAARSTSERRSPESTTTPAWSQPGSSASWSPDSCPPSRPPRPRSRGWRSSRASPRSFPAHATPGRHAPTPVRRSSARSSVPSSTASVGSTTSTSARACTTAGEHHRVLVGRSSGDGCRHQLDDLLLDLGAPALERVRHRPQVAVVEVGRVLEAEGGVPVLELARVLEEDDDLAVRVRVGGHSVPGLRRQVGGGRRHRHVNSLSQRTVPRSHLRDGIENRLKAVGLLRALLALGTELGGALLHRGALLGGEAVEFLVGILRGHGCASFRGWARRGAGPSAARLGPTT